MARHKDAGWNLSEPSPGRIDTWEEAGIAVLMDIRDRLDVLRCPGFQAIPRVLRNIDRSTRPARRRRLSRARHAARHKAILRKGRQQFIARRAA